ncbi:hypothetical protein CFOL_v3_08708, partial [Cephalotus follicularis]
LLLKIIRPHTWYYSPDQCPGVSPPLEEYKRNRNVTKKSEKRKKKKKRNYLDSSVSNSQSPNPCNAITNFNKSWFFSLSVFVFYLQSSPLLCLVAECKRECNLNGSSKFDLWFYSVTKIPATQNTKKSFFITSSLVQSHDWVPFKTHNCLASLSLKSTENRAQNQGRKIR